MSYNIIYKPEHFCYSENLYINQHGVEITIAQEAICISAAWPGIDTFNYIFLEIVYMGSSLGQLIDDMELVDVSKPDDITVQRLEELYQLEKAIVMCLIDHYPGFTMNFEKQNGIVIATGDLNVRNELQHDLQTPEQYIAYTRTQYEALQLRAGPQQSIR